MESVIPLVIGKNIIFGLAFQQFSFKENPGFCFGSAHIGHKNPTSEPSSTLTQHEQQFSFKENHGFCFGSAHIGHKNPTSEPSSTLTQCEQPLTQTLLAEEVSLPFPKLCTPNAPVKNWYLGFDRPCKICVTWSILYPPSPYYTHRTFQLQLHPCSIYYLKL